jgi:hypothetical protein
MIVGELIVQNTGKIPRRRFWCGRKAASRWGNGSSPGIGTSCQNLLSVKKAPELLARFGSNLVEGLFCLFGFAKILIEP